MEVKVDTTINAIQESSEATISFVRNWRDYPQLGEGHPGICWPVDPQ
jgi:hypothetical protein